jgi:hypothetical protein
MENAVATEPFTWRGIPRPTIGDLLNAVCALTDREEAARFMDAYRAVNDHADANIGYIIGYIEPASRRQELYELVAVQHPVFGGTP